MFQAVTNEFVCHIVFAFLPKNVGRTPLGFLGLFLLLALSDPKELEAAEFNLIVHGGEFSRSQSVVSFDCPQSIWNPELDRGGRSFPVQLGLDGRLHFLVESLDAGETRRFRLRNRTKSPASHRGIWLKRTGDAFKFELNGKPIVQYQGGGGVLPRGEIDPVFRRGGYLHPVWSPSGLVVSDDYPENHLHHHGIWDSWTKTEYDGRSPNFWETGHKKGAVEFDSIDNAWSGAVFGGIRSRHRFVDLTVSDPVVVLNESWELKVYAITNSDSPYRVFDLSITQECATEKPLKLPQYRYGGLGFRGHQDWDGAANANFLTGLGESNRIKGHATRAPWCHIGGRIGDQLSGLAIFCHPKNFRAPQPMRIHPTEPFFCYAPAQLGDWEIRPGQPYRAQYRFIVFDGSPKKEVLDLLWLDYSEPVKVSVVKAD